MKRIIWFILVVCILTGAGYVVFTLQRETVSVVKPTRGKVVEAVYATGRVEPVYWAQVASEMSGQVREIVHDEGEVVSEGDTLARIDEREAAAALNRLRANAAFISKELTRQQTLGRSEFAARKEVERLQSELAASQAEMSAARKRFQDSEIRAPYTGWVLKRFVDRGEYVQAGQVLFSVGQPEPLKVVAEVDEEDIPRIWIGQKALLLADAYPGKVTEARVSKVIPQGDPASKIFLAEVQVPPSSGLYIGMTTEVNLIVKEQENARLLPMAAVLNGSVWMVENGHAVQRDVKTGVESDKAIEVLEGISDTAEIIMPFPSRLKEGQAVRAAPAEMTAKP